MKQELQQFPPLSAENLEEALAQECFVAIAPHTDFGRNLKLPRGLILPVVSVIALLAIACSKGVDQNSTQKNYTDIHPELSAFFDNLEKERKVSPPKNQLSSSVWQQPMSKTVEVNFSGFENYSATGNSQRFTPDFTRRLDTTVDLSLRQKTCIASIFFQEFKQVEYVTNTDKIKSYEETNGASAKNIEISNCGINQVTTLMNEFLSRTP